MGTVTKKAAKASVKNSAKKSAVLASSFVHLHNHTQYSLLDGLTKIGDLVKFVKESGMEAVTITDHGTLSGWIEFYKTCKGSEVKPLLGIETYMAARKLTDKDPAHDRARYHLILIAMNEAGVHNIMRLSTIANLDGFYYFPRIDRETLEKHSEGVICLSGCMGSELGQALKDGRDKDADQIVEWYKRVFGDRYYLEVQDHGHPDNPLHSEEQRAINEKIIAKGKQHGVPCVVTSDAHYLRHEDQDAHEVLLCVGTGSFLADTNRMSLKDYPLHVETPDKIIERWGASHPELITNTKAIADRVNFDFELGKILIPQFPLPSGEKTEKAYLDKLVWRGLAWRYGGSDKNNELSEKQARNVIPSEIVERADYELSVIDSMGFNGYFLIIWDFIKWGKDNGIVFGPGRGSAAGSVVSYGLRITELDPLLYDLLFERFLNPDRISMPDIDIDIADDRRNEVIEYCRDKYGEDRVANIVTFGRMAARNAVRDTARVLQVPYSEADRLAKMIPPPVQGRHIPLAKSLQEVAELKAEYEGNPQAREVFEMAMKLEGTIRSHGVHAAGVVIAPDDIVKFVPLERAQKQVVLEDGTKKDVIATQFSMNPIEDLGLLKMDFLGLSNLTIIKNALRIIKKVYSTDIDIADVPMDDSATFELLQAGDTTGVFQLESAGMKRYLKELKPTVFDDIIAMVALYRPGPMQWIEDFINRKHGKTEITYLHPTVQPALESTYGVIVYQEQVMQISKEMSGFTGGQADTLRKGIGKKIPEVLAKLKGDFIEGAIKTSQVERAVVEHLWGSLEDFAAYCFNKSHAACYGLIAYQTAYLKAHYPSAFMAALMTSDWDNIDRLAIEIAECRHMGIEVLPPDVNYSFHEFSVANDPANKKAPIRFGLDAVKNVGKGAVEEILLARQDGVFTSIDDFISRVSARVVNRKTWESLIKAGAMDSFGDRATLLHNLDTIIALGSKIQKERLSAQVDLFGGSDTTSSLPSLTLLPPADTFTSHQILQWERELLGLYLSHHPLEDYDTYLDEQTIPIAELRAEHDNHTARIGGTIADVRQITTKNGQNMAFVKLEDRSGEIELVIFPSLFKDSAQLWQRDHVVTVTGRISARDKNGTLVEDVKLLPDSAEALQLDAVKAYQPTGVRIDIVSLQAASPRRAPHQKNVSTTASASKPAKLYIRVVDDTKPELLIQIKEVLDKNAGQNEVVLVLGEPTKKQALKLPFKVEVAEELTRSLAALVGATNVVVQ